MIAKIRTAAEETVSKSSHFYACAHEVRTAPASKRFAANGVEQHPCTRTPRLRACNNA
ncbi:MAG: hypothetical protein IPL00_19080 [Gammaproteobacteria bacterium]|nr:hypothetical protein [Gammaproteobacteria bacterium]